MDAGDASRSGVNATSSETATTYVVHMILPCDEGDHVLAEAVKDNDACNIVRLPRVRIPIHDEEYFAKDELERKLEEACPYPVCLVKRSYIYKEDDIENPGSKVINDMWEVHAAGDLPAMAEPLKWIHKDDLPVYRWLNAIQCLIRNDVSREIGGMFDIIHSGVEIPAKPWETLGFYKRLVSVTQESLQRRNMVMEGRVRLMQDGQDGRVFTCTARVKGERRGDRGSEESEVVFIKCTFPVAGEVERTMAVGLVFGKIVSEIIGFDVGWGILVQRDVGRVKDERFDQEALIGSVLYMQRVSLKHIEELERKGLRVMDSEWLESNIESILNHAIFDDYFNSMEESLSCCDEERETAKGLRSKMNEIRQICRQVTELGLPNTIVHGDCDAHNIGSSTVTREGKLYRIFDWAKAYIGNPLVDLDCVLSSECEDTGGKVEWEAGVGQICGQWKELAGMTHEEIRKAIRSIRTVALLLELFGLEEQHDSHMGTTLDGPEDFAGHGMRLFNDLSYVFENLGHLNERLQSAKQSGTC